MSFLANFYQRRKRGIAVTLSLAGGVYLLVNYAKSKFEEAQQKVVDERAAEDNIRRRFRQTQEDCAFAVQALLPNIVEDVIADMNVEELTALLQSLSKSPASSTTLDAATSGMADSASSLSPSTVLVDKQGEQSSSARSKNEIWQDIKVQSLSRSITALYIVGLLSLQSYIQLNILGKKSYLGSLAELAEREAEKESFGPVGRMHSGIDTPMNPDDTFSRRLHGVSQEVEMKYLTFSWWLLNSSWKRIAAQVKDAVEQVFGKMQLKATLTPNELARLLYKVRLTIEGTSTSPTKFTDILLPLTEESRLEVLQKGGVPESAQSIDPELRHLLDESCDLFDSHDFTIVSRATFEKLFQLFSESLYTAFKDVTPKTTANGDAFQHPLTARIAEVDERNTRLVNLLPPATRETRTILAGLPNAYVEALQDVKELQEYCAIIFCPNSASVL